MDYIVEYFDSSKAKKLNIRRYSHIMKKGEDGARLFFVPVANMKEPINPANLPWKKLDQRKELKKFIEYFRNDIEKSFKPSPDYVIIDARTGFTEIGGLFTVNIPDIVVLFTGLNEQNLQGTKWVLDNLRTKEGQAHMIVFSPLPEGEERLKKERLEEALKILEGEDLARAIIPYHPMAAFKEQIFVRDYPEG